jgi:hypothetical protein
LRDYSSYGDSQFLELESRFFSAFLSGQRGDSDYCNKIRIFVMFNDTASTAKVISEGMIRIIAI